MQQHQDGVSTLMELHKVLRLSSPLLLFVVQTYLPILDAYKDLIMTVLLITKVKCQLHYGQLIGLELGLYAVETYLQQI
jgi:hypothetical protein